MGLNTELRMVPSGAPNGLAERAVQSVRRLAHVEVICRRAGQNRDPWQQPHVPWSFKHVAWLLNTYRVPDGGAQHHLN